MAKNLVLYRGVDRPLISVDHDDEFAQVKLTARAASEFTEAAKRGEVPPVLKIVEEERVADAGGVVLLSQTFTALDPVSLKPVSDAKKSVAELFAE